VEATAKLVLRVDEHGHATLSLPREQPRATVATADRGVTVRSWLTEWLDRCETRGLRATTVASYRTMTRLHLLYEGGRVDATRFSRLRDDA
jgi:hypothetical protein